MKIITNNVPRLVIEEYELTVKEREEFDYLDWQKIDEGKDSASFFRYKGELYDLDDLERSEVSGWDGIHRESFFGGILVRICDNGESVVVGRYYT